MQKTITTNTVNDKQCSLQNTPQIIDSSMDAVIKSQQHMRWNNMNCRSTNVNCKKPALTRVQKLTPRKPSGKRTWERDAKKNRCR